ncbi:hypothetical protein C3489_06445 [Streptomyces sp. Ru71]|nr:hypothetical protein C3489_06445 [Streptomyces sp. Ru71]
MQLQGGGGRQRGGGAPCSKSLGELATDDNAAGGPPCSKSSGERARPRDAGMIQTTGPSPRAGGHEHPGEPGSIFFVAARGAGRNTW